MSENEIFVLLMFLSFIGLLFTGFPIAWILSGVSVVFAVIGILCDTYLGTFIGIDWNYLALMVDRIWALMTNWVLVSLPMFILMGLMLERSGIAEQLLENLAALFGRLNGGYAITVTVIGILLAASTGIVGASVALLTMLSLPVMLRHRYKVELATGTICAVGTLGILIPPSIMLVVMADQMSLSVGDLFMGALIPGLMLGGIYIVYLVITAIVSPDSAPAPADAKSLTWPLVGRALASMAMPMLLILMVLGSIFLGVATPTESSGLGVVGATLLALWNRRLDWRQLKGILVDTTRTVGFIFSVLVGATAFSLVLRGIGGDEVIDSGLHALSLGPEGTVLFIMGVVFLLGFFLDWMEITLIVLPLVAPVMAGFNIDLVWFTVLMAICLQTSFLTPPVGFSLFYLKGAAPSWVTTIQLYRGVAPFILLQLVGLALVFYWPSLVTWLPAVAYGP